MIGESAPSRSAKPLINLMLFRISEELPFTLNIFCESLPFPPSMVTSPKPVIEIDLFVISYPVEL